LGLKEKNGLNYRLGFGLCKQIDQICLVGAGPRPPAQIGHTLVIDGNDGNTVRGLSIAGCTGEVIIPALQATGKVRGRVNDSCNQNEKKPCKPVRSPEFRFLCLFPSHFAPCYCISAQQEGANGHLCSTLAEARELNKALVHTIGAFLTKGDKARQVAYLLALD
jgi:hypothetical protein